MSSQVPDGYIDPKFPNPNGPHDAPIIIYGYTPALALAVLGVILFTIATVLHLYQILRYRTKFFAPLVIGCTLEIVGYVFRILSSKIDPYNIIYFVVQYFFIVVAPVIFSIGIYIILTVLINLVGREHSPIPPRWILGIFITVDCVSTVVQIIGAAEIGVAYNKHKNPDTANHILLAGLCFQCVGFLIFIVLLSLFLWRARAPLKQANFRPFLLAVYVATLLIFLRTSFRLAETAQGLHESLSSHEVFFGCLEFTPVVLAVYILLVWHPGRFISGEKYKEYKKSGEEIALTRI